VNPHVVAVSRREEFNFLGIFGDAYPDRFCQGYIAEQNMISVGVGPAARGKVPFLDTFACFHSRAYDQVRMAAISRANINLCGSHCGVSIGEDGPSQMALSKYRHDARRAQFGRSLSFRCDFHRALTETMARRPGINYLRTSRP
jgi:transketolase